MIEDKIIFGKDIYICIKSSTLKPPLGPMPFIIDANNVEVTLQKYLSGQDLITITGSIKTLQYDLSYEKAGQILFDKK